MKCPICEIGCRMLPGVIGRCGMYVNEDQTIIERFPDAYVSAIPISIENRAPDPLPAQNQVPAGRRHRL